MEGFTVEQLQVAVANPTVADLMKQIKKLKIEKGLLEQKKGIIEENLEKPNVSTQYVNNTHETLRTIANRLAELDVQLTSKNALLTQEIEKMLE
jgi:hypothetical protein